MRVLLLLLTIDFNDRGALVETALASHPTLAASRAEAAAARERITSADALPNPMLMIGTDMAGASQRLVRPSKRASRRRAAELEARAAELAIDAAGAEVERDVLLAWWEIAAIDAQLRGLAEVREMVDAIVAAARVRYEVGTSAQADVIRAQLQASELEREAVRLRGARRAASARLVPLLDLPPGTEIPPLAMPEGEVPLGPADLASHPGIAALEAEAERAEEAIRLVRLELKPDADIAAEYERDMVRVVARIEIPFLRRAKTIEPMLREAMLRRDAARTRIEKLRRALNRGLGMAMAEHSEAAEQIGLHDTVLMPQSKLAFDSTLAAYQTGKTPFDAVLTTEADYLRLHLQYYELLLRRAQAAVTFEALRRGARGDS